MSDITEHNPEIVIKKKRGRKKKSDILAEELAAAASSVQPDEPVVPKKRGRKPKGGKIITKLPIPPMEVNPVANIILHLKCSMTDIHEPTDDISQHIADPLSYLPNPPPTVVAYVPDEQSGFSSYSNNATNNTTRCEEEVDHGIQDTKTHVCSICKNVPTQPVCEDDNINMKDLTMKLKILKHQLHKNSNPGKKSACFWCTYEYDNPPCYIPKYEDNVEIGGYGSFCRPECAVAYLLKENIDDSAIYERYQLLNKFYGKVYNYTKNIKPAPDPHYLLEKFYGNMTIQEYRKLLSTEHMLLVIDKPMTRILPELHDDNEDITASLYGNNNGGGSQTGIYKVKRQSEKQVGPSKSTIMKESFGLS